MLGTAHVSQASAAEVARVVAAVQPECVVVELCKSRVGVLHMPQGQQEQEQQQVAQLLQLQQQRSGDATAAAASSDSAVNSGDEEVQQSSSSVADGSRSVSDSSTSSWWQSLRATNPMQLSGSSFPSALARSARLGGQSGLLLRLLIAGQARKAAGAFAQSAAHTHNCVSYLADKVVHSMAVMHTR